MKNPIPQSHFIVTPTMEEMKARVKDDPSQAMTFLMTVNLCHQLVEDEIDAGRVPDYMFGSEFDREGPDVW